MEKIKNWVHLNDEGKKLFGYIFPGGVVPTINCIIPSGATLRGLEGVQAIWKIDIKYLTKDQFEKIVDYIAKKENGDRLIIKSDLENLGFIPLQDKYVSGCGTSQMGMFL